MVAAYRRRGAIATARPLPPPALIAFFSMSFPDPRELLSPQSGTLFLRDCTPGRLLLCRESIVEYLFRY